MQGGGGGPTGDGPPKDRFRVGDEVWGDEAELVGLRSRPDLNGRCVVVKGRVAGNDGAPRIVVQLWGWVALNGRNRSRKVGQGEPFKVKAENLKPPGRSWESVPLEERLEGLTLPPAVAPVRRKKIPGFGEQTGPRLGSQAPEDPSSRWDPEDQRDWAGLPAEVLAKVAETVVAQTEREWAAWHKNEYGHSEQRLQQLMDGRKASGNCLFPFAMVHPAWRAAQLKVGGQMRTRVGSDVILPGRVNWVKWALQEGCPRIGGMGYNLLNNAALFGHLEVVRWLILNQGFEMDEGVMSDAARGGNLELVHWLWDEGCEINEIEACQYSAELGHLEVLQFLRADMGCEWSEKTTHGAASRGRLDVLRWALHNGCPEDRLACSAAAAGGHLEVLQWMKANRYGRGVSYGGYLGYGRGGFQDCRVCTQAARSGHLEVLQWLRAEGCPWDWATCHFAVNEGHVEVLRWARENGCPWLEKDRDRAAAELGYTDDLGNLEEE